MIGTHLNQIVHVVIKRQGVKDIVVPEIIVQALVSADIVVCCALRYIKTSSKLRHQCHQEIQYVFI